MPFRVSSDDMIPLRLGERPTGRPALPDLRCMIWARPRYATGPTSLSIAGTSEPSSFGRLSHQPGVRFYIRASLSRFMALALRVNFGFTARSLSLGISVVIQPGNPIS